MSVIYETEGPQRVMLGAGPRRESGVRSVKYQHPEGTVIIHGPSAIATTEKAAQQAALAGKYPSIDNTLSLALIACLVFFPFGLPAVVFSLASHMAKSAPGEDGDAMMRADRMNRRACHFAFAAILAFGAIALGLLAIFVLSRVRVQCTDCGRQSWSK